MPGLSQKLACLVMSILWLFSVPAMAEGTPLVYAGYAFSGDYANRASLYPYSAELSVEENNAYLDRLLRERIAAHPEAAARLQLGQADGALDHSSVAFALVQESVEQQRMDGKFWTILTLHANILAFNRATQSIVASYPVRLRLTRAEAAALSPAELKEWVRSAYAGANAHANIFDQWLAALPTLKLRSGASKYLKVTNVGFTPEAQAVLDAAHLDTRAIRNQLANAFEASVAESAQISLIPNSVGEAIGSKMAYRFPNGAQIALALPQADFELSFTVRGFASKTVEKPAYYQDIFRVLGAVKLAQPDLNETYLDENIYETQIVTRPRTAGMELETWPQYYKTLQLLMAGVSQQMNRIEDRWLQERASRGVEARPGFVKTNDMIRTMK
ncbi:exported hypothetical protein [Massilia sp. 9I]|nr:exported hypothetical protein [Massilia sp. 9I]